MTTEIFAAPFVISSIPGMRTASGRQGVRGAVDAPHPRDQQGIPERSGVIVCRCTRIAPAGSQRTRIANAMGVEMDSSHRRDIDVETTESGSRRFKAKVTRLGDDTRA